jgi:hypothetical protein
MYRGIVGYTAERTRQGVILSRAYAGHSDTLLAWDWKMATEWLTKEFGKAFHITYNLKSFADAIFSLLPKEKQTELEKQTRVYVGNIKIFYVDRWLGLTKTKHISGNFYERSENNFFGISH